MIPPTRAASSSRPRSSTRCSRTGGTSPSRPATTSTPSTPPRDYIDDRAQAQAGRGDHLRAGRGHARRLTAVAVHGPQGLQTRQATSPAVFSPTGRRSSRCATREQSRRCIVVPSPAVTGSADDVDALVVERGRARGDVGEHQQGVGEPAGGLPVVLGDPGQPGAEVEEPADEGERRGRRSRRRSCTTAGRSRTACSRRRTSPARSRRGRAAAARRPTQNSTCWKSRELSFFSGAAPLRPRRPGRAVPAPSREPLAGVRAVAPWWHRGHQLHLSQVGEAGVEAVGAGAGTAEGQRADPADVAAGQQRTAEAGDEQQRRGSRTAAAGRR